MAPQPLPVPAPAPRSPGPPCPCSPAVLGLCGLLPRGDSERAALLSRLCIPRDAVPCSAPAARSSSRPAPRSPWPLFSPSLRDLVVALSEAGKRLGRDPVQLVKRGRALMGSGSG